ncbi:DUF3291 domain-containing protein [Streptomyces sudanensis]|uniref:DUF3291 domain-containing protein n=1 Tax=Streptomyces sudanensis TaxID=436397 RepID=UPI0020CD2836|nr:DUF3291 domain-containing protein [Streptomyces sudanensis]MCP9959831.1 DUF3291 domain-containing protein [Streptomyces sudanensis]MCP9999763.1 DUF3291 domain-containing protein [Streptomyces sudanensis]
MPVLPWTASAPVPPHAPALVMASRFEVRSAGDVPRFLLKSLAARRQAVAAPGAYGVSLLARPLRRTFHTLSAWRDRDALDAYVRAEPHRGIMRDLRPVMRDSAFVFWETTTDDLPPTWDDALRRLAAQAARDTSGKAAPGRG